LSEEPKKFSLDRIFILIIVGIVLTFGVCWIFLSIFVANGPTSFLDNNQIGDTKPSDIGSRSFPVPLGDTRPMVEGGDKVFQFTVDSVIRGEEAWNILYNTNRLNRKADPGKEWILIYINLEYISGLSSDVVFEIDDFDFGIVSNNVVLDKLIFVMLPAPALENIKLFPEASVSGWIAKQVFIDDSEPLLYMGSPAHKMFYFSLTE
jgi:hypothetical protein